MPIDYNHYPSNWLSEIRPAVLLRAQNVCECCGVGNYQVVRWENNAYQSYGPKQPESFKKARSILIEAQASHFYGDWKIIVLTIAHLDHDVTNNEMSNLKALCQRCHLNHDRQDNARRRKYGKHHEQHQLKLLFENGKQ